MLLHTQSKRRTMEKAVANLALGLQESVLGGAVVILLLMLFLVLKLVFAHIRDSDKRWSDTVNKNTEALNKMTEAQRDSSDKIAEKIERAIRDSYCDR